MKDTRTDLYFVRHGETDWNKQHRTQGRIDIPLNESGREQARRAGQCLSHIQLTRAFSSGLRRAQETAAIILGEQAAAGACSLTVDSRLSEIDFGQWEGLTRSEIAAAFPDEWRLFCENPMEQNPPGGEPTAAVRKRALDFVTEKVERHEGEKILIVSHGGLLRTLFYALLGMDLRSSGRLRVDNASISLFHFRKGRPQLVLLNWTDKIRGT